MTNRLSFWICVAIALTAVCSFLVVGLSWAMFVGVLQVPLVLAVLLLARAIVLWRRGQPWALRFAGRDVLGGRSGFTAPILFVLAMTVLRETGVVSLRLSLTRTGTNHTTMKIGWSDEAADAGLSRSGLVVHAPSGPLGDAFAQQLHGEWLTNGRRLYGDVTFTCDAPFAGWPLVKSATVNAHVDVRLQMRPDAPAERARGASIDMKIEHSCSMIGIASRRDFHEQIGAELGQAARKAISEHVAKAD
ncbi:MAG TPA: hypothetical protein VF384_14605 [Planctomycetota bacterium]